MPLSDAERGRLFGALEARGWRRREQFIYALHETMWLLDSQPWVGDLEEFHERMTGRLQRTMPMRSAYKTEADHKKLVDDTESLVQALREMLDEKSPA